MEMIAADPKKYGGLLAKTQPKIIESDQELERFAEILESSTGSADRSLPRKLA